MAIDASASTIVVVLSFRLGVSIGKHPFRTIALCWLLVVIAGFGFLRFRQEKDPLKLWVPPQTTFLRDSQWLMKTLHRGYRDEAVLIIDDDVLTPKVFQQVSLQK